MMTLSILFRSGPLPFLALGLGLALAGCGKPVPAARGGGDFPVLAVIAPVVRESLEESLRLVGSVRATEQVELVSEIDSTIEKISFKEGERVKKGQVLLELDNAELKASLDQATARVDLASSELKRGEELLGNRTISEQEIDRLRFDQRSADAAMRLAREQFEKAVITAPFEGVISEHDLSPGQYVARGQRLVWLVQTTPLEVEFNVPERYVSQVAKNQKIELESVALPGRKFEGTVDYISPRLDVNTRTALVKARIENKEGHLKPGMYGTLNLIFRLRENVLTIPEAAVTYRGDQPSVVVVTPDSKAEFRGVQVGLRRQEKAEITQGLSESERVVVEGYQKMGPGATVLISPESTRFGITPPPPPGATVSPPAAPEKS